jgi:CheY-like chemotaxis protein
MLNIKELEFYTKDSSLLIVEDDEVIRSTLKDFFIDIFGTVYIAQDGQEGIDTFDKEDVDIVITDLTMPNIDGIQFAQHVKSKTNVPVIVLSATDDVQSLISLINIGVNYFIPKPCDLTLLCSVIVKSFESKRCHDLLSNIQHDLPLPSFDDADSSDILENDIKTSKDLYKYLLQSELRNKIDSKMHSVYIDGRLLVELLNDLMLYGINIDKYLGNDVLEDILVKISKKALDIHYKLIDFNSKPLEELTDIFFEYHNFFASFKDVDTLSSEQIDEILHVKFISSHIKNSVESIFNKHDDREIYHLIEYLKSDLDKIKNSIYSN